jgi:anti-anti-sigma regulatory factor
MLRISIVESSDNAVMMRLDGKVAGCWVEELQRSCEEALTHATRLTLDLTGVTFIHSEGMVLFRSLASRHVVFTNPSQFVAQQLKDANS